MSDEEKEVEIREGFVPPEPPGEPEEIIQKGYVPPPPPEKPKEEPPDKRE